MNDVYKIELGQGACFSPLTRDIWQIFCCKRKGFLTVEQNVLLENKAINIRTVFAKFKCHLACKQIL